MRCTLGPAELVQAGLDQVVDDGFAGPARVANQELAEVRLTDRVPRAEADRRRSGTFMPVHELADGRWTTAAWRRTLEEGPGGPANEPLQAVARAVASLHARDQAHGCIEAGYVFQLADGHWRLGPPLQGADDRAADRVALVGLGVRAGLPWERWIGGGAPEAALLSTASRCGVDEAVRLQALLLGAGALELRESSGGGRLQMAVPPEVETLTYLLPDGVGSPGSSWLESQELSVVLGPPLPGGVLPSDAAGWVVGVAVAGPLAFVVEAVKLGSISDVSGLCWRWSEKGFEPRLRLRWSWPAGVQLAQVVLKRGNRPAAGPDDPTVDVKRLVTPAQAPADTGIELPLSAAARETGLWATVYAAQAGVDATAYAPGITTGSRRQIIVPRVVRYRLQRPRLGRATPTLLLQSGQAMEGLPPLRLICTPQTRSARTVYPAGVGARLTYDLPRGTRTIRIETADPQDADRVLILSDD